ncbi:putative Ig domain-containing protein [Verrucomicrobiota bacterium]
MRYTTLIAVLLSAASITFAKEDPGRQILTPPPSATPRINGAKIFGARPGNPFLFKVAATGKKPLEYSAENLPSGLKIDSETGIITGKVTKPGEYKAQISVANKLGKAERELRIKIGDTICLTPPMGWNSWYCHSHLVSEDAVREIAKAMYDKGLVDHGWTYVNIDDCWQGVRGGKYNAIQPNERFTDMKAMCDYVHSLGLKPGLYSTPWVGSYAGFIGGSCYTAEGDYSKDYIPEKERLQKHQFFGRWPKGKRMNKAGKYWFFDKDAKQWAEWGFDYVKADWWKSSGPNIKRIHDDLLNCGRDIVFSLANNATLNEAEGRAKYANCWRTSGDIKDQWGRVMRNGLSLEPWLSYSSPGHWNDPDMLQVGMLGTPNQQNKTFRPTKLTPDQQYTQVSLWCIVSAPLLLSCDIASLDDFTLSLLTNDEVIEVNQDPGGMQAIRLKPEEGAGNVERWVKPMEDGSLAVCMFNLREKSGFEIKVSWKELGIEGEQIVRDLWRQKDLGVYKDSFSTPVNNCGVVLVNIRAK